MCIWICIYIYVYVYIYAYVYVYVSMYIWMCMCTYVYIYMCVCMYACACLHLYMYMYIYESICIFAESRHAFTGVVEHHACADMYVRHMLWTSAYTFASRSLQDVHMRYIYTCFFLCCFYYFVRNSLVALLEALYARIFSWDSWISVLSEIFFLSFWNFELDPKCVVQNIRCKRCGTCVLLRAWCALSNIFHCVARDSFVYTCVCVFLHIQSPLRECSSIRSGASGLPCYCSPLVCVSAVMELLAVWRHNKPKTKKTWCNGVASCVMT